MSARASWKKYKNAAGEDEIHIQDKQFAEYYVEHCEVVEDEATGKEFIIKGSVRQEPQWGANEVIILATLDQRQAILQKSFDDALVEIERERAEVIALRPA